MPVAAIGAGTASTSGELRDALADAASGADFGFGFAATLDVLGGVFVLAVLVAAFGFGAAFAFALALLPDAFAGALPDVAFGFGPGFALGVFRGTLAVAGCICGRSADLNVTTAGPPAVACPVNNGCNGTWTGTDCMTGFGSATRAGASSTRRSGTSTRRSCQGKAKPGIPNS